MLRDRPRPGGRSTTIAARLDARCSYSLYGSPRLEVGESFANLLVFVHGEGRRFQFLLNSLMPLANECSYLVVCPLFPANILRDGNAEGYKYLREGSVRYDRILLDIVAEIRSTFAFESARFLLGGYSGGAQYCHRFAYFHANQLEACSIAAPGSVTLLDPELDWWPGIRGASEIFDAPIDIESLKKVRIQLVVGERDTTPVQVEGNKTARYGAPSASVAGTNRVDRLRSLHQSWSSAGIAAQFQIVPEASHRYPALQPAIAQFFRGEDADLIVDSQEPGTSPNRG